MTHGFEAEREDGHGEDEFEIEGPEFDGGKPSRSLRRFRPGTYEVYCYIGDHEDPGVVTPQLVVREDAPLQSAPPASTPTGQVAISGFAFSPQVVRVATGTEVTWQNQDPAEHTVTEGAASSDPMRCRRASNFRSFSTRRERSPTSAPFTPRCGERSKSPDSVSSLSAPAATRRPATMSV